MLRNTKRGYGWIAIILHWTIACAIVGQWTLGKVMKNIADQRLSFDLIQWHTSFGFLILALVVVRLLWRFVNPSPALPPRMNALERQAAGLAHRALYAFAADGTVRVSADGGDAWAARATLPGEPAAVTAADANGLIVALHDGTFAGSDDGGRSWSSGPWASPGG